MSAVSTPGVAAILDVYKDEQGNSWYQVTCSGCRVDLSDRCLGRLYNTGQVILTDIYHPLRCPSCGAYLLPYLQGPKVWKPGRVQG